ncbi:MAG: chromosome partitioning protein ParB, partial [Jatrophihabitans sp.]
PYDEVVAALGYRGERSLGLQTIKLESIVGSVDSTRNFDRQFRPTSSRGRERWQRLALAQARGESVPPIDVFRIGDLHFVKDGHHRVSIAVATGQQVIDAYVIEVRTVLSSRGIRHRADLLVKDYERMFYARVPLSPERMAKIVVTDPWSYAELGENVEAWGYRAMQHLGTFLDREEVARRWFVEEFTPVVRMLRTADLLGSRTDAEAYMTVASERYRLIRTHDWTDEVIERIGQRPGFH